MKSASVTIIAAGILVFLGLAQASVAVADAAKLVQEDFETAHGQDAPEGWSVDSTESVTGMRPDWQGWSFHTLNETVATWGGGGKHANFTKASGTLAIVQSDGNRPSNQDLSLRFSSTLWTPTLVFSQHLGATRLKFDTHYRKGQAPQAAKIVASYDGGPAVDVMNLDKDYDNESIDIIVAAPPGVNNVKYGWSYLNSANNWYWMIDNVVITEAPPGPVTPKFRSAAKPVAAPGQIIAVEIGGFREGMQPKVTWNGFEADDIPQADKDGIVQFSLTIPDDAQRGFMPLQISGDSINTISQTITIQPNNTEPYHSLEPRLWSSTLDDFDSWSNQSSSEPGWQPMTRTEVVDGYGTDIRQSFTRADGTYAHVEAGGGKTASLTSPKISLPKDQKDNGDLELRLDAHLRIRGTSEQKASITAIFDSGQHQPLWDGHADLYSAQLRLPFSVPTDAKEVSFAIEYASGVGTGSFSFDNVYLTRALPPLAESEPLAVVDVFSDVQGSLSPMCDKVMPGFQTLEPKANVLVVNGDLVGQGTVANWDKYVGALNGCGRDRYETNVSVMGNHEYFAGGNTSISEYRERFLDYTGMRSIGGQGGLWGELLVDDELPLLWIASEGYDYNTHTGSGPFVTMSDEQYYWLSGRLEHYRALNQPVLLFSHFVFPNSVSGTYIDFNARDYGDDAARVSALLQQNPNVVMVTSHTHWGVELHDWSAEKRFDPSAEYGFNIFNSGSVTTEYGPNGDWKEAAVGGSEPTGLRVNLYNDRVRVSAYRFSATGPRLAQELDIARPATAPNVGEATLTLSSDSVVAGQALGIGGAGWEPEEEIRLSLVDAENVRFEPIEVGSIVADDTGNLEGRVTLPGFIPAGNYLLRAEGEITKLPVEAQINISAPPAENTPSLRLGVNVGKVGDSLELDGSNWSANAGVDVVIVPSQDRAGAATNLGRFTADSKGAFSGIVTVPQITPGKYTVVASNIQNEEKVGLPFEVLAASVVTPPSSGSPVPPTGSGTSSNTQGLAATGASIIAVITAVFVIVVSAGVIVLRDKK